MKRIVKKCLQVLFSLIPFLILYILIRLLWMDSYLPEWQVHNRFCYLWIVVAVLAFWKPCLAYVISYGNVPAIALGEVVGTAIRNRNLSRVTPELSAEQLNALYYHPGFEIWIFSLLGIVVLYAIAVLVRKKYRKAD